MFEPNTKFELATYNTVKNEWEKMPPEVNGGKIEFSDPIEATSALTNHYTSCDRTFQLIDPVLFLPKNETETPLNGAMTLLICAPGGEKRPISEQEYNALHALTLTYEFAIATPNGNLVPCNELATDNHDPSPLSASAMSTILQQPLGRSWIPEHPPRQLANTSTATRFHGVSAMPMTILVNQPGKKTAPISPDQLAALRALCRASA